VDASHDFALDHNRCILCTRCVRVCDEIEGRHTWDVMGRGVEACLVIRPGKPWGEAEHLHELRQVRAGLPDRRAGQEGHLGRPRWTKNRPFLPYLVGAPQREKRPR
jgi:bidirectional [NiFe] hydrogenase diaphorase subunit